MTLLSSLWCWLLVKCDLVASSSFYVSFRSRVGILLPLEEHDLQLALRQRWEGETRQATLCKEVSGPP